MPRIFSFERELYATLSLMPLSVRRKLDLAGLKLSLEGWQSLSGADRRALAEAEVEDDASVAAFTTALREAAARAGATLQPLPQSAAPPWRSRSVPPALAARVVEMGVSLPSAVWSGLDDDARFALVHLGAKRSDEHGARLLSALQELGIGS
jgi:hypothetical protein